MATTNEKALDEFMKTIQDIRGFSSLIRKKADNHFDTNPDRVNWSHVGDARHVKEMLQEVLNFIEGKG
jgi:hypothetical protein